MHRINNLVVIGVWFVIEGNINLFQTPDGINIAVSTGIEYELSKSNLLKYYQLNTD